MILSEPCCFIGGIKKLIDISLTLRVPFMKIIYITIPPLHLDGLALIATLMVFSASWWQELPTTPRSSSKRIWRKSTALQSALTIHQTRQLSRARSKLVVNVKKPSISKNMVKVIFFVSGDSEALILVVQLTSRENSQQSYFHTQVRFCKNESHLELMEIECISTRKL